MVLGPRYSQEVEQAIERGRTYYIINHHFQKKIKGSFILNICDALRSDNEQPWEATFGYSKLGKYVLEISPALTDNEMGVFSQLHYEITEVTENYTH